MTETLGSSIGSGALPASPPAALTERLRAASWDVADVAMAVRWGATILAVIGTWAQPAPDLGGTGQLLCVVAIIGYAAVRTLTPVRSAAAAALVATVEMGFYCTVAGLSGGWGSPYLLCVSCSLVTAGLVGGLRSLAAGVGLVGALAMAIGLAGLPEPTASGIYQRVLEIFFMGLVGYYAGRIFQSQTQRDGELQFLRSANDVNSLLLELHSRAAEEPWTLTLRGAVSAVLDKIRERVAADSVVMLLCDSASDDQPVRMWQVAAAEGIQLPPVLAEDSLPGAIRQAMHQSSTCRCPEMVPGQGLDLDSTSGLYAPLWSRSTLVGFLVAERRAGAAFDEHDSQMVDQIARHAGLAIDNTRLFARLRRMGAEVERDRIARELHDRVGQSLAAVALTADRLALDVPSECVGVKEELDFLAGEIRGATRQIREKLSDLRTAPTVSADLSGVIAGFLDRVANRSGIAVKFVHQEGPRLPPAEEHEIWRILQEAVINAERHADATVIEVFWGYEAGERTLLVRDDGIGLSATAPLRRDAYGILGMRERAEVIGAGLTIETQPGCGTAVRVRLRRDRP